MKRNFLGIMLILSLAACNPGSIASSGSLPAPSGVATHTTADEAARQVSEETYKFLRVSMEALVDSGVLKGAAAGQAQQLNRKAYAAVVLVRKAYETFNATDLLTAARDLAGVARDAAALVKGH